MYVNDLVVTVGQDARGRYWAHYPQLGVTLSISAGMADILAADAPVPAEDE